MKGHSPNIWLLGLLFLLIQSRWTQEQAAQWYSKYQWGAGVNYIPAYAVNEIEMWQKLDLEAINRELTWAHDIGFSKLRVFLHISPYIKNSTQFKKDIFSFLAVAKTRGFHVVFVLFDDCWKSNWMDGDQPNPIPGIHNSQWVQCPGKDDVQESVLQKYVTDIIGTFKNSDTIVMWDLYNEVGNSQKFLLSLPLLKKIFQWARTVNASQPLTSCWFNQDEALIPLAQYVLSQSDVITFHAYCDEECTKRHIQKFKKHNRPVICTEYMARPLHSKFITHLPLFKSEKVWAINWGFVFGRTQTYYPWWSTKGAPVPEVWFHDVVKADGSPFDPSETDFIRNITRLTQKYVKL